MKIFLSALETNKNVVHKILKLTKLRYSLVSYFYVRKNPEAFKLILDNSDEVLIDSGAYSFQVKGGKTDWEGYTREYAAFIRMWDCPKIIGYFEMDIDVLVGYEKVLQLRKILEKETNKIIPVWHKNRGIDEFKRMCEHHVLPFMGQYYFAYIPHPKGKILGLSKIARVVDYCAARMQIQERLVHDIVEMIAEALTKDVPAEYAPLGIACVMKAHHTCKEIRGARKKGIMSNSCLTGLFLTDTAVRSEFMSLVNNSKID